MRFLAEIDPVQIIIIVIAMGAGFIQWLWGLMKQKLEESERRNAPPLSAEELARREEAWKKQIQQSGQPPRPSPKSTPPPPAAWDTVREVFEKIQEESRKARQPQQPPRPASQPAPRPAPAPARSPSAMRGTVRADTRPAGPPAPEPPPVPTQSPVLASPAQPHLATVAYHSSDPADTQALRSLLKTPASLRQAVLLKEILGPPKALQSSGDSPF